MIMKGSILYCADFLWQKNVNVYALLTY